MTETPFTTIVSGLIAACPEIRLYDQTLFDVAEEHQEAGMAVPDIAGAVERALQHPTRIEAGYGGSLVFVDQTCVIGSGDALRILVGRSKSGHVRVRTIYFASAETAPGILWAQT